ncbi:MAG TPA: ABC transporter permease [Candidatus Acidoferrales bacterium]|nr:ABC transporter permease [Candidatus Acidoferrales bacterium]
MTSLLQDIRYAIRILAKAPGFTIIAILTLALGIGANTALFSLVDGVLLNPLPYAQPDRLVAVYTHTRNFNHSSISYPNFLDWVRDNRSFSGLAAFRSDDMNMTGLGEPERLRAEMVSANFFSILGVKPVVGRSFVPQEDQIGAAPVVLISEGLWKRKFAASPTAVGKALSLNGTAYTIVGVIPGDFHYTSGNFHLNTDVFVPIGQWDAPLFRDRRTGMGMDAVGRLAPGVTLAQARADMDGIAHNLATAYPDVDKDSGIAMLPLREDIVGNIRPFLLVLLAAVGFVLLIACANVANLLLVRATGRAREFAIRAALGAAQTRVIRQLLTESVLLSLVGGALGSLLAAWGTRAALGVLPNALPRSNEIHLNVTVLLFALAISILVGIIFGLVPALKTANPDLHETLKEGGRGGSGARHRTQNTFVVVEMALALVLLVGAGLMIRSLAVLWGVSPGFNPHNALQLNVASALPIGGTPDAIRTAFLQLHDRFAAVPGVQTMSLEIGSTPMQGDSEVGFWPEGQPKPTSEADTKDALFYSVQPDYLKAMGIPLIRGRFITADDNQHSPPVIVVDQEFARLAFGNENPIGKRVSLEIIGTTPEIVGVVGHVKQWGLDEGSHSPVLAQFYFPISQVPDQFMPLLARGVGAVIRTQSGPPGPRSGEPGGSDSPLAVVGGLRSALAQFNSQLVMFGVQPLDEVISDSLASRRFSMILLGVFAALALILSAIGIYGVISYIVGQRTHEIGIRLALGAHPSDVMRLILGQGTKLALIGVAIGIVAAFALTRLMTKMIFGVSAHDPLTFIGVAVVLIMVALAACYFPARRAMRTDPMVALRYE